MAILRDLIGFWAINQEVENLIIEEKMSDQLKKALLNVRKAYALLEDYQQRVVELMDFVRGELGAIRYNYRSHSGLGKYFDNIYSENDAGRLFLPFMDVSFLWLNGGGKDKHGDAYNHQPGDLLIDARVCSNTANCWPSFKRNLQKEEESRLPQQGSSELRLYVLQRITAASDKYNWRDDVWWYIEPDEYNKFNELINCRRHEGKYQMYAESFDLENLGDEKAVRDVMNGFKQRVMKAFRPKCPVNRFEAE